MYHLTIYYPGDDRPRLTVHLETGRDALDAIRGLLKDHAGCERIDVHLGVTKLFAADGQGNTSAG